MKGKIIAIGIAVLLIVMVFTGCLEQEKKKEEAFTTLSDGTKVTGDFDKVEILSYNVETLTLYPYQKLADGFVYSENAGKYDVYVKARNIAGELIRKVHVYINHFDEDNNFLWENSNYYTNIRNGDTWNFTQDFLYYNPGFEKVHHISFRIKVDESGNISSDGSLDRFIGEWKNEMNESDTHFFHYDGSYFRDNATIFGNWEVKDNKLIIEAEDLINPEIKFNYSYDYSFSGDNMKLFLTNETEQFTYDYVLSDWT